MRLPTSLTLATLLCACGAPELQTFQVTIKTVRSCRPGGILGELCEDPSKFANQSRTTRFTLEQRGPTDFILYEADGRALPGHIDRGHYFARAQWNETGADGCARTFERSFKFQLLRDVLPTPPGQPPAPDRIEGNLQDRASQSEACGQLARSRTEETFAGDALAEENPSPFGLPTPAPGGGA